MVTRIRPGWSDLDTTTIIDGQPIEATAFQPIITVLETNSASVSVDIKTTIVTWTATSTDANILKITGSCEFPGEWQIFKNTVLQDTQYTGGGGGLNATFALDNWGVVDTDVIDVKFEHGFNGRTPTVYATIWGY
jgi:hypothetical protein